MTTFRLGGVAALLMAVAASHAVAQAVAPPGMPVGFAALPDFRDDDHRAALAAFRTSCAAVLDDVKPLRAAQTPPDPLKSVCRVAQGLPSDVDAATARAFFETHFTPRRIGPSGSAFFTGYYEPVVDGSLKRTEAFPTPLFGRPAFVVPVPTGSAVSGLDPGLTAARKRPDGTLVALPDRQQIEAGTLDAAPLIFVHDQVEAFFIQVQGSARIRLADGTLKRLVYAGRNGYPYTSIGKILAQSLHIPPAEMGMGQLKAWIREHGQSPGEPGAALMQRNRSYIFFDFDDTLPAAAGPLGGAGVSVSALRSLAVDRSIWAYGLPMYADAELVWRSAAATPFRRLMIAQDTGSAILGPARADIFFGTGPEAARHAGTTRAAGTLYVLWPKSEPPPR